MNDPNAGEVSTSARPVSNREDSVKLGAPASYKLIPVSTEEANVLVSDLHRHNGPLKSGVYFSIGLADASGKLVGAVTVGGVAARGIKVPWVCEVRRLVTDGSKNGCSMLYGAAWRAAQAMGYEGMITYTLTTESGASLKASNWRVDDDHVPVRIWPSRDPKYKHLRWSERPTTGNSPALPRIRWFIGRRVPSHSKVRYPDDPPEMGTNAYLDSWNAERKKTKTDTRSVAAAEPTQRGNDGL